MAYRDWLKEYREVNSVQKDSAQQKPTPGSTGSGGFRDSLNAYRKSQAPNIFADLQKSLTIEYDSYKNMKPTFGKYDETSKVINERLSSISHLRSTVEAYRNYMQDGVADGILSDLDQMKKDYDAYLGMSKYETADDYNAAVNEWQDYTEQLNFDTAAEEKAIAEQIERYNQFFGIEATYKEVSSRPSMYTDDWVAEVTSRYNDYKDFIAHGGSLEDLKQSIQQRQVYLNNAKRLQEGVKLASVSGNDDFDEFSGYSGQKTFSRKLLGLFPVESIDETYEYINNQNGARDEINRRHDIYNADNPFDDGESFYEEKGYDYMTEDEIAIYNYYYAKGGKEAAEKYLDNIQGTLNHRKATGMFEQMEDKILLELAFGVAAGLDQFESGVKNLFNTEDDYIPASAMQMASGMVREDLADDSIPLWYNIKTGKWEDKILGNSLGQIGYDTVTTTANMAPSILTSMAIGVINPAAGEIVGTTLMGASAAGNAYQEALNLGYSKSQARAYSTLVGASEAGLQYLIGGIGKLGGKLTGGTVSKALNGVDNAIFRAAGKLAGNMISEGFEEGIQEILTPWFKNIALHMNEDVDWNEVAYSGLLGALTAGFLEGGSTIAGEVSTYKTGKHLQAAGVTVQRLSELGKTFAADTVAYQLAGRVNESTGAYTMGRLFNEIGAELTELNKSDIASYLEAKGVSGKDAKIMTDAFANVVVGGKFTDRQISMIEANDTLAKAVADVIINPNSTVNQRSQGFNEALMALAKEKTSSDTSQASTAETKGESELVKSELPVSAENASESRYKVSADGKAINTKTGEAIDIKGVASIRDGEMVLETSDGNTINASEVSYASEEQALIYEAVANLGNKVDAKTANKLISQYKGGNALVFAKGISQAYSYGFWGIDKSELRGKNSLATELTDAQMNYAYGLGSQYRVTRDTADKAKARATKAPAEKGVYFRDKDGSVTDIRSYMKKANKTLTPVRKIAIEVMEKMSAAMGIRFNIFESWTENGVSYYLNEDGVKTKGNPNGFYDPRTGEIYIDINAGNDYSGTMLFTVAHELTHFLRQWSPEHFTKISKIVFKHGGMKGSVAELVAEKQKKARSKGRSLSFDAALEEVVADGMETILKDGKVLEFMAEIKLKDRTAWNKIKEWFDKLGTFLKELINAYDGRTANSVEGQYVAEFSRDLLNQIEQIFAEGMVEAGENYQGTVAETDFLKAEKNTIKDGGVKMMIRENTDIPYQQYRKLLNKKPMKDSKKFFAKVEDARIERYRTLSEGDIPDLDFLEIAEYNKLNEGYVYTIRNYDQFNFAILGKRAIRTKYDGYVMEVELNGEAGETVGKGNDGEGTQRKGYETGNRLSGDQSAIRDDAERGQETEITDQEQRVGHSDSDSGRSGAVRQVEQAVHNFKTDSKFSDRDSAKYDDRDFLNTLSPAKRNALLSKKPIQASKKDWAKVNEERMRQYSRMEESEIPDLDVFSLAEYGSLDKGYLYFVRNYGKNQFVIIGKKRIVAEKRNVIREEQTVYEGSNSGKKTYPNDDGNWSGRGSDTGDVERPGNGRKLQENDTGAGKNGETVQKSDSADGSSDSGAVKHSDRDYSYEALISKPDMTVTAVDSNVPKNRADVVYQAKQNAAKVGKFDPKTGSVSVYVDDIKANVLLGTDGLKHGLRRTKDPQNDANYIVTIKAGEIIKNSVKVNEMNPTKVDAKKSLVLVGIAKNPSGDTYVVRSIVNRFSNELTSIDVLYAINAKKQELAATKSPRFTAEPLSETSSTISIADLLDLVNQYFPDILPEDVLKHYGYDARPEGDLGGGVLYQERADRDIDLFDIASCPKVKMSQSEYRRLESEAMIWNADKTGKVIYQTLSNQYTYVYCFDESHNIIVLGKYKAKNIHERQAVIDDKRNRTKSDRDNGGSRRRRRTDTSDVLNSDGGTAKRSNSPLEEALPETRTSDGRGYVEGAFDSDKTGVKMSERDTESFSNRSLLANALESLLQNEIERNKIQEYKDKIGLIDAEERKLRELNEQIKELSFAKGKRDTNKISQLRDKARKAANRISIYDKQLLRLEASKPLQEVLDREKKKAYKKAEKKGQEALAAYHERAAKAQQEMLDRYRESRKKAVESRERTAMRHKIRSVVGELNQLLLSDDKKRHVPDSMKRAVADALALVNMDTVGAEERAAKYAALIAKETDPDKIDAYTTTMENILRQGEKTGQRLKELRDAYEEIQNSDDPDIANAYDPVIAGSLKELSQTIGNTALKDMTIEQLSDVYDMYKMVLTRVRDANKSLIASVKETIANRAFRVAEEVRKAGGDHKYRAAALDLVKTLSWNNLKPVYAMERIGSATMTEAYNNVRKGEDTWAKDVTEARAYYIDKSKKYGYDSWDFQAKYRFESASGLEFELTLEQILSLYAFSKREQAHDHLWLGGFVFDSNIETYKEKGSKILKYKVNTADAHQITPEILANITGMLTKEQMNFVDEMQEYLSAVMGAKGNEVTIAMYGVKLFKEKFYFPLKTAKQFMFEQNEVSAEVRIKNAGFTNKVVPKANNPVILSNFIDVWANHIIDMSMYHAFVLPLEDFNRIFNYNSPRQDGKPPVSVKGIVQNAYGPAAVNYVKQLITDLNGGPMVDPRETFVKAMTAKFKKAKVFSSLSVVIQQPSAIARAFALVDLKYFQPTRDGMNHDALWAELKQYAPVAIIKEMGYFDTNMGRSTLDFIKAKEYDTFKEKAKAIFADAGYRDAVLSRAPALADELTWCAIWNAIKRETAAKHNELNPNSEEFLKAAGERFTEVITKTQVYDSVLARSANMRSKSGMMNMITSFMAEATTSINMLEDAIRKSKRGYKGYAAGVFASVLLSVLLNNALVALVYGMRDDDEDETFAEKYMQALVSGVLEDINPITYYPFLRDVWSASQGYSIDRSDMSLMSDLADALTGIAKAYITEDGDVSGAWWDVADAVANIGGVPLENIRRDVNGAINLISTIIEDVNGRATTWGSMGDALESAVRKSLPVVGWFPGDTKADNLYDAIISGDTAYVDRLKGSYKTKDAYHSAVRKTLRENDPRIKEAAIAGFNGNPSERVRISKQIIADGFDQDDVVMAINAEITAMKPDVDTGSSKKKGYYTAADFAMEIANGDHDAAKAAKEDIIKTAERNGKSAEEAEKSFVSSAKTELKELFVSDGISEAKVATALKTYCQTEDDPLDDNDIYWLLRKWNYEKDTGSTDGYAKYGDFHVAVETGRNLKTVIKEYTDHGVESKTLASEITEHFKPIYQKMSRAERAAIKGYLLNAYTQLGYDRQKKSKDIDKWLED